MHDSRPTLCWRRIHRISRMLFVFVVHRAAVCFRDRHALEQIIKCLGRSRLFSHYTVVFSKRTSVKLPSRPVFFHKPARCSSPSFPENRGQRILRMSPTLYHRRVFEIPGHLTEVSRRYRNRPQLDQRSKVGDYLHLLVERTCTSSRSRWTLRAVAE